MSKHNHEDGIRILKNTIRSLENYKLERSVFSIVDDFMQLMLYCPINEHDPKLWEELRNALAENPNLHEKDLIEYVCDDKYAKEGFWWYDYNEWKKN